VELSARLYELLVCFVEHRGELLSRDQLLDKVWGFDAMPTTRTVDVHVSWLRQRIEPDPSHPRHLLTVRGQGYRFVG
jgi:two-component system OmpR family response regulator